MIRRPNRVQTQRKVSPHNHSYRNVESNIVTKNEVLYQLPLNNNFVKNALVVNLPQSADRLAHFLQHNYFKGTMEIIEAVDGLNLPKVPEGVPLRQGSLGCLLSHKKALEYALSKEYPSVLIFEDDAEMIPEFSSELNLAMSELPQNWDMLWLAGNDASPSYPYSKNLKRMNGSWGTYAYVINRNVYEFFIELFSEEKKSSDDYFRLQHPRFNSFRTVKPLALHKGGVSDRMEIDRIGKAMN